MFVKGPSCARGKSYFLSVQKENSGLSLTFASKLRQVLAFAEFSGTEVSQWDPFGPFGNVWPSVNR